jgi:hypothetical protein
MDNSITITKIAEKIERLKNKLRYEPRRKTKREWTTPNKYHTDQDASPISSRVVVEISYNIRSGCYNEVVVTTP